MLAAAKDHVAIVAALVGAGADLEALDDSGSSALMLAASAGCPLAMQKPHCR